jgi:tetratricopeptide (TPR) repeat protein
MKETQIKCQTRRVLIVLLSATAVILTLHLSGCAGAGSGQSAPTKTGMTSAQGLFAKYDSSSMTEQEKTAAEQLMTKAALAENWGKIIDVLAKVRDANLPVEYRIIRAHAFLATNGNNESFRLFSISSSEADLLQWKNWSQDLLRDHPKAVIAHYFWGDALARLGDWKGAIGAYSEMLDGKKHVKHPLLFNARGVAFARDNEPGKARVDFEEAVKFSKGKLADAYANIGVLRIQEKNGAEAAKEAFNKAIEITPTFALAFHERACIRMVLAELAGVCDDFKTAEEYATCPAAAALMIGNRLQIAAYWRGMSRNELLAAIRSGQESGTTLYSRVDPYREVRQNWDTFKEGAGKVGGQWKSNRFTDAYQRLTPQQQAVFYQNSMAPDLRRDPTLNRIHKEAIVNLKVYNEKVAPLAITSTAAAGLTARGVGPYLMREDVRAGLITLGVGVVSTQLSTAMERASSRNIVTATRLIDLERIGVDTRRVGGVDMSLDKITWDGGEWPFQGYYGLLFHVDTTEFSLEHSETAGSDHKVEEGAK